MKGVITVLSFATAFFFAAAAALWDQNGDLERQLKASEALRKQDWEFNHPCRVMTDITKNPDGTVSYKCIKH